MGRYEAIPGLQSGFANLICAVWDCFVPTHDIFLIKNPLKIRSSYAIIMIKPIKMIGF
jgi:hypothetical protein